VRRLRAYLRRLWSLAGRARREREFADELNAHLDMHVEDNLRAGMSAGEARRQALVKLGGVEQTKQWHRDQRSLPWLETALHDLRFAFRLMWRSPGFTLVVLATLAIGIGGNSVMFSIVNTVLLRPLPYRDPARLVSVRAVNTGSRQLSLTAAPDFYEYRAGNRSFERLEAFYNQFFNLTDGRDAERLSTLIVSAGMFATLGIEPALGRGFVSEEEQWGSHRVAMISDGLWRRRFGGDPRLIGQRITLNGEPYEVVGILPPRFSFIGLDPQLFVPMSFEAGDHMNSHSNYFLRMIGRLKPSATPDQAAADVNAILERIIAEHSVNAGTTIDVVPLRDMLVASDVRRAVLVLLGAVGFVLLITCANLANLLLARAAVRQREIALRLALGASRARLIRQFLVESLVLAATGGALGLGLAYLAADGVNLIGQRVLPRADDIRVDPAVLLFTFAVATISGILLGLAPAAHGGGDVNEGLKEGTRTASTSIGGRRLRAGLVVAEVALSLVLLVGAGLLVKSMYHLLRLDAGFDAGGVLTMQINLPPGKYVDRNLERQFSPQAYTRAVAFFDALIARVRTVPGATIVGAINGLPLAGEIWGKNVTFWDRPLPADFRGLSPIQYRVVAGDYFRAMGIRIVSGRAFTGEDSDRGPMVAIVNRALVRRDWNGQDPVGKIISVNPPLAILPKSLVEEARRAGALPDNYEPARFTVVGVAEDVRYGDLATSALPLVYVPYAQGSEGAMNMFLTVRTDGDPLALTSAIRTQIAQLDRDQPVAHVQTMEARVNASLEQRRLQMNVLGLFAAMAALLAAIGLYGVMSYFVTARSREIGIRLALGAARRDVVALVLRQGFVMVSVGVALGFVGALLLTRILRSLLFNVSPTDPLVFAGIVLLLALTSWIATYIPARRAARLDPLVALRAE
jgi:putative ABC transport system permease protein